VPLYEISGDSLVSHDAAEFRALDLYEKRDLQRLLREDISVLGDDLLVIAEEYSNWEDAKRRIDLLAVDQTGRLVVIELKRTETGGHMDLQAVRYAAMVSSLSFEDVLEAFESHSARHRSDDDVDPRSELETFLDTADDEPEISSDVRIILVSADFGPEITTTALWLSGFGVDIRCVRLVPYEISGKVLLDIQQVLPLPEAADYQVRLRRKDVARERKRSGGRELTRYHIVVEGEVLPEDNKRNTVRAMVEQLLGRGIPIARIKNVLPPAKMVILAGRYTDPEAVRAAFAETFPKGRPKRYFTDQPFVDEVEGKTYVLSNQWGTATESKLTALSEAFPEAKVGFRRAGEE
jgi:hypothetical protein